MGGSKRKKTGSTDFKHIKAKVGKRAPQPANYTDTDFKAVSINVRNQTFTNTGDGSAGQLISGQGRAVLDLLSQLHHPTTAVRLAGVKGILDVVKRHSSSQHKALFQANISTILTAVGKTAVDEEFEVRKLGMTLWESILLRPTEGTPPITPFVPLVVAFFASALNSLDGETRRDGLVFVQILAQNIKLTRQDVVPMLPAIARLWRDKAFAASTIRNEREQKHERTKLKSRGTPNASSPKNGRQAFMASLLSVLEAVGESHKSSFFGDASSQLPQVPTNRFLSSGHFEPTIQILNRREKVKGSRQVRSLQDLPAFNALIDNGAPASNRGGSFVSEKLVLDLLNIFRDCLAELQQEENEYTLRLSLKAMKCFWDVFDDDVSRIYGQNDSLKMSIEQIAVSVFESFPWRESSEYSRAINGLVCWILVRMINLRSNSDTNDNKIRLRGVMDHISDTMEKTPLRQGTFSTHEMILESFGVLLGYHSGHLLARETKLIQIFANTYFPVPALPATVAKSGIGQLAASAAWLIFASFQFCLAEATDKLPSVTANLVSGLVDLLVAWEDGHIDGTVFVLDLLSRLSQSPTDTSAQFIAPRIEVLLEPTLSEGRVAVIELYPEHVQRLLVSLLVSQRQLSLACISNLARICARGNLRQRLAISAEDSAFLLCSVFSIRRKFALRDFLRFLVDGTGLSKDSLALKHDVEVVEASKVTTNDVMAIDRGVREVASCLVSCPARKITGMLSPFLHVMLTSDDDTKYSGFRRRMALQILSSLSFGGSGENVETVLEVLPNDVKKAVSSAAKTVLGDFPTGESVDFASWTRPAAMLLSMYPELLIEFLRDFNNSFASLCEKTQMNFARFFFLFNRQLLEKLEREQSEICANLLKNIEVIASGGTKDHFTQVLNLAKLWSDQNGQQGVMENGTLNQ